MGTMTLQKTQRGIKTLREHNAEILEEYSPVEIVVCRTARLRPYNVVVFVVVLVSVIKPYNVFATEIDTYMN